MWFGRQWLNRVGPTNKKRQQRERLITAENLAIIHAG